MKMIDVFNLMAKDEIKNGTEIVFYYDFEAYVYKYHELYQTFLNNDSKRMEEEFVFGGDFLNYNVKLIPPKEKVYLVKFNMRGLRTGKEYLNYDKQDGDVSIYDDDQVWTFQTRFTEKELQDIKQVREFLEDMKGKYRLIEVE